MTQEPAIRAEGLVKEFGSHRAVAGIDLEVPRGSVFALLGPNGAGKTTTVRMLATLLRPDSGRATVFGHDVAREPAAVRKLVSLTGQYASVDNALTATENLVIFGRLRGLSRRRSRERAAELLRDFDLPDAARRPVSGFSGGMRRRLDLAASLVVRPALLFLDEPTTGLDPRTRNGMWSAVRSLVDEGTTVLLTTQYLEEADRLADRIAVIDRGRVVATGTAASLKDSLGRSSLRLRVAVPAQFGAAKDVLTGLFGAGVNPGDDASTLTVPVEDPGVVADVALALRARSVRIGEIAVVRPSLDEVFLSLTGPGRES